MQWWPNAVKKDEVDTDRLIFFDLAEEHHKPVDSTSVSVLSRGTLDFSGVLDSLADEHVRKRRRMSERVSQLTSSSDVIHELVKTVTFANSGESSHPDWSNLCPRRCVLAVEATMADVNDDAVMKKAEQLENFLLVVRAAFDDALGQNAVVEITDIVSLCALSFKAKPSNEQVARVLENFRMIKLFNEKSRLLFIHSRKFVRPTWFGIRFLNSMSIQKHYRRDSLKCRKISLH